MKLLLYNVHLTIAKNERYLFDVTNLYKDSGLITKDGLYNLCKVI